MLPKHLPDPTPQTLPFVLMSTQGSTASIVMSDLERIRANFRTLYLQQWPGANLQTPIITHSEFAAISWFISATGFGWVAELDSSFWFLVITWFVLVLFFVLHVVCHRNGRLNGI
jgi:hypothetical protein